MLPTIDPLKMYTELFDKIKAAGANQTVADRMIVVMCNEAVIHGVDTLAGAIEMAPEQWPTEVGGVPIQDLVQQLKHQSENTFLSMLIPA